jgi:hypothetical protein
MGICRSFVAPPPPPLVLLGWWEMRKGRGRDADGRMGRLGGLSGSLSFLDTRVLVFSFWIYGLGVLVVCIGSCLVGPKAYRNF